MLESVWPCGLSTWLREVRRFADTPLACEVETQASCLVPPTVCKSDAKAVDRLKDMKRRPVQPSQEKTIQAEERQYVASAAGDKAYQCGHGPAIEFHLLYVVDAEPRLTYQKQSGLDKRKQSRYLRIVIPIAQQIKKLPSELVPVGACVRQLIGSSSRKAVAVSKFVPSCKYFRFGRLEIVSARYSPPLLCDLQVKRAKRIQDVLPFDLALLLAFEYRPER